MAGIIVLTALAGLIYFVRRPVVTLPDKKTETSIVKSQYVDSSICADCHPKIAETYLRTGMGRSFSRPTTSNTVGDAKKTVTFYHKPSDSYFTNIEHDGKFFQRRYQIGFDGKETNSIEKEIHFVMGSGNHARAYLHRTSRNTLIELPFGWYAEKNGSWAMSPGYDRPDHPSFTRAVTDGCMFCHNGIPHIQTGSASRDEPVFSGRIPEGIDCQRCHGPGGDHVKLAEIGTVAVEDIRKAIVNPARLIPDRQMEVCMQCHLQTTSFRLPNAIVRFDREPFSYRPGEPLSNFILHFDHAPGAGREDKFEIAGAVYRLRRSACFQKSEGSLQCTTCHNPHDIPHAEEGKSHYTSVCRGCHESAVKQLVNSGKHPRSDDCISCHMPKRRTDDVVHAVMTDHLIQRRKPARDLVAPMPERHETEESAYHGEVMLYYPQTLPEGPDRDLYLAVAQVSHNTNLTQGVQQLSSAIEKYRPERMEFYLQLADAYKDSGHIDKAVPLYEEAVKRSPQSLLALQRLGFSLRSSGQLDRAAEILKRALTIDGRDAASWHQLGLVYLAQGSRSDAFASFQKAVDLDSDLSETHNSLGGLFLENGNFSGAEREFREAIRIMPDYAEAHSNLASALASTNRLPEARYHFETAIRLKPDYAAARFNYGIALARSGDVRGAIPQFRKVAEDSDPALRDRAQQILQQLVH